MSQPDIIQFLLISWNKKTHQKNSQLFKMK